ncbi:MAG TPA: SRPBCC family protein [Thermoleophilaceae bacterium]|nr:SRPBCC family protein [Thermoleophilaceae bacterium]
MPTVVRSRTIPAPQQQVWELVSDPYHLPRWWPTVQRVEDVSEVAWTTVATSPRGRAVRFDWSRVYIEPPERIVWRQELAQTPFERFLRESVTGVILEGAGETTKVELRIVRKLRGLARFGGIQMRRAARKELDRALDQLEAVIA